MNSEEPLLIGAYDSYQAIQNGKDSAAPSHRSETGFLLRLLGPLVITFFLQYLMSVTSIFAAGKLGAKELAAVSLAVCTYNITGLAVYQGMATSLDSLCSQAYGQGKLHNVGLYFQRCLLMIMAIAVFLLAPIWWFLGLILLPLVPDKELAYMAQTFLRYNIWGVPPLVLFETGKRFLQAQHLFSAATYVLVVAVPVNFVLNWLLVWHPVYGLGFVGTPIAVSISYWLIAVLMLAYVVFVDGRKCWGGFHPQKMMSNWLPMFKLALPGVLMVEAEYLAFEVLTILAASFGTEVLAAQSILSNVGALAFQLQFAISVAATTRIGHYLGQQRIDGARKVVLASVFLAAGVAVINFSYIFFGRLFLSSLFTKEADVRKACDKILVLVAVNQLMDPFNVLAAGVLRGQGRQHIGSILNMISYYLIALPLGYVLGFKAGLELAGLWYGLMVGVGFLAASQFVAIYRTNWPKVLEESNSRHDH